MSYYISSSYKILQFCSLLNAFSLLQKLDQAQEINTQKISGFALPSPSSLLSLLFLFFFPSELATRVFALVFSPRRYPDSWVSSSFQMLAHGGIVMTLQSPPCCALQPPYISIENKFTKQKTGLSITLNKLLFFQLLPEKGREKGGRERRDKLFYDSNTNPLSNACMCVFPSFFIFFPCSLLFFLLVDVKCKSGVYPALLQHETHA